MRYFLLMVVMLVFSCKPDTATNSKDVEVSTQQEKITKESESQKSVSLPKDIANERKQSAPEQASKLTSNDVNKSKMTNTNFNVEGIPDACDLLSVKTISRYVRQPEESIFGADGSSPQNLKARACFFKWDGSALKNAGVMIQLQKNPVKDDVPEYFTYLISSKKTEGEKDPVSQSVVKYKDWPGFGDDGAYSTVAGRYIWRVGNDWSFMVAFNTVLSPKAQKVAAEAFAKEVMSNMDL